MKCFYHDDRDGQCCSFWVSRFYHYHPALELISLSTKDKFPIDTIKSGETVYIVDYSIAPDMMKELLKKAFVVWIDHHIGAIDDYKNFPHDIEGIRYNGISGCELTWIYLYKLMDKSKEQISLMDMEKLRNQVPLMTRLIGDFDTWQWKFGMKTRIFTAGLDTYDTDPRSEIWTRMVESDDISFVEEKGNLIIQYETNQFNKAIKKYAYYTTFEGHKAIACNSTFFTSLLFDGVKNAPDLKIVHCHDGVRHKVSLYSDTVSVVNIAKKYGGNGHKGAAGFNIEQLPFTFEGKYIPEDEKCS